MQHCRVACFITAAHSAPHVPALLPLLDASTPPRSDQAAAQMNRAGTALRPQLRCRHAHLCLLPAEADQLWSGLQGQVALPLRGQHSHTGQLHLHPLGASDMDAEAPADLLDKGLHDSCVQAGGGDGQNSWHNNRHLTLQEARPAVVASLPYCHRPCLTVSPLVWQRRPAFLRLSCVAGVKTHTCCMQTSHTLSISPACRQLLCATAM